MKVTAAGKLERVEDYKNISKSALPPRTKNTKTGDNLVQCYW